MHVIINRTKMVKRPENEVTSHLILEPHHRQKANHLVYDENGIFSKRIFGNLYKCDCGLLVDQEGICENCGTRVIDPSHMPDFYCDLGCKVLVSHPDFDAAHRYPEDKRWNRRIKLNFDEIKEIANYESFIYCEVDGGEESEINKDVDKNGELAEGNKLKLSKEYQVVKVDDDLKAEDWDQRRVLIGEKALLHAGIDQSWLDESLVDFMLIPHTMFRPMVISGGKPFITQINERYSKVVLGVQRIKDLEQIANGRPLYLLSAYRAVAALYHAVVDYLFNELQDAEYSILKSEIISHPISGAIRATLINRHDVNEDVIIIGDTLIPTLYPYLYQKYLGDMEQINKHLVDHDIKLLVNRAPTIAHASIMSMKPRIASIYPIGHCDGTDGCLKHQSINDPNRDWYRNPLPNGRAEPGEQLDKYELNLGDVESYGQGLVIDPATGEPDGIDTLGLRCIGMNPIMMDAMNADNDGDVLLSISLYGKKSIAESITMLPSNSYMNYANMSIRNHIIEDFILAKQWKEQE